MTLRRSRFGGYYMPCSAVPRWSHRDPVEPGNPLPLGDPRHAVWEAASSQARTTLKQFDAGLETGDQEVEAYAVRLVGLAVARFDTWARRGQAVVMSAGDLEDYEAWLSDYRRNWLAYVADTCPHVDVDRELRSRLAERVEFWIASASAQNVQVETAKLRR